MRSGDRAGEALDQFLAERAAKPLDPQTAAFLVASGAHAIMVGDLLNVAADSGYVASGCPAGAGLVREQLRATLAGLRQLADRLSAAEVREECPDEPAAARLRDAALICLRRWRADPDAGQSAIAVAAAGEWLEWLGTLAADLEEPVAEAARAARVPWWR